MREPDRRVSEQAGHVAHVNQAAGAQRAGHAAGHEVGVHIVGLAVVALRHRRDHRHEALADLLLDELHLHLGHVADVAEIDLVAVVVGLSFWHTSTVSPGRPLGLAFRGR
jgi:hypothetical protein